MENKFKRNDVIFSSYWCERTNQILLEEHTFVEAYETQSGEKKFILKDDRNHHYIVNNEGCFYKTKKESLDNFLRDFLDVIYFTGVDDDNDIDVLLYFKDVDIKKIISPTTKNKINNYINSKKIELDNEIFNLTNKLENLKQLSDNYEQVKLMIN